MSAPMRLTADDLGRLRECVQMISNATRRTQVRLDAYMPLNLEINGSTIQARWDEDADEYVIDDRVGS